MAGETSDMRQVLRALAALRREILESKVEAQQQKTSDLERTISDLDAEREGARATEQQWLEQVSRLEAHEGSTPPATAERALIEAEKEAVSGPELERLHLHQSEIDQQSASARQMLSIEQQRLREIQQRLAEVQTAN